MNIAPDTETISDALVELVDTCLALRAAGPRIRRQSTLQAFKKNVRTRNRFRLYSVFAAGDSALHAVDEGRLRIWFVAVRWPRQAGMTLLTRRPLPSNRRPMPSCL
jgi:hypothetical protein